MLIVLGRGVAPLSAHPDVWTGGSFVGDDVSGACFFLVRGVMIRFLFPLGFRGHLDLLPPDIDSGAESC